MTKSELERHLAQLALTQTEAARLLNVTPRTVRRWLDSEDIPGPVEQALKAWLFLHKRHLPWGPDSVAIAEDDQEQIALHRAHAIGLAAMLAKVDFRGGSRIPWTVNVRDGYAELGPMRVSFYRLTNGGFSLCAYSRSDQEPSVVRDKEFIEDAAWCIAQALKRAPENA
jgi:hypothetical protein